MPVAQRELKTTGIKKWNEKMITDGTNQSNGVGWVKLPRTILSSKIMTDAGLIQFLCWCRLKANWEPKTFNGHPVPVGSFVTGRESAMEQLDITASQFRWRLGKLESLGFLKVETTNKFSTVTVLDFEPEITTNKTANHDQQKHPITTNKNSDLEKEKPTSKTTPNEITTNKTDRSRPTKRQITTTTKEERTNKEKVVVQQPTLKDCQQYGKTIGASDDEAKAFFDEHQANGWRVRWDNSPVGSWRRYFAHLLSAGGIDAGASDGASIEKKRHLKAIREQLGIDDEPQSQPQTTKD